MKEPYGVCEKSPAPFATAYNTTGYSDYRLLTLRVQKLGHKTQKKNLFDFFSNENK